MAVDCSVHHDDGRLIAALSGDLDLHTVAGVRLSLLKCLAEHPSALVLDLSRLTVSDPLALTVLGAVRRQAARWPGIPLLLSAPDPPTHALLRRAPHSSLPTYPTVATALAEAGRERHSLPMLIDELQPVPGAPRRARDLATEGCMRWELPALTGPASLVVSELVSNSVDHAHTAITVRLTLRSRFLHIAVRDGAGFTPGPRTARGDGSMPRGRGLLLVEATARRWGWLPTADGKVVWASLSL